MAKTRKNVSIDSELAEIVDQRDEFNLSGFVNRCLETHFAADSASEPEQAVMRAELEEIERELSDIQTEKEKLRQRKREIEEQLEEQQEKEPELLKQARSKLKGTPKKPENPAIQNWAGKLGMKPEQLINEL